MSKYTKDPNALVTTVQDKLVKRYKCKYIGKEYHEVNVDCFKINNTWYRTKSDKIIYDHELKKWRLKTDGTYVHGVIDIDKNNNYIFGDFTPISSKNIPIMTGNMIYTVSTGIDYNIVKKGNLSEGRNGVYYHDSHKAKTKFANILDDYVDIEGNQNSYYSIPWMYSSAPLLRNFLQTSSKTDLSVILRNDYYKHLPYSFGVEFETDNGAIPERYLGNLGLIPCRDGSIGGFEYVTVPLQGKRGLQFLYEHCKLLSYFCLLSRYNSLHVHLGGYPITKESIAGLYRMLTFIQEDIYNLFPVYYKDTSKFKRRNYCSKLNYISGSANLETVFMKVIRELGGSYDGTNIPHGNHPMDISGEHKWQVSPRYKIINLIPLIWGNRGTVEFRIHTPTSDFNKLVYWLFICTAILKYAEKYHTKFISPTTAFQKSVSLQKIIKNIYPKEIADKILDYIDIRTKYYYDLSDSIKYNHDVDGSLEIADEYGIKKLDINNFTPLIKVYD